MFYGSLNKLRNKKESDMTEIQYHLSSIQEIIKSTENPSEIWKVINKNNLIQLLLILDIIKDSGLMIEVAIALNEIPIIVSSVHEV